MSAGAIALVLAAAFLHAAWNLKLHAVQDRVAAMAVAGIGAGLVLLPFTIAVPPDRVVTHRRSRRSRGFSDRLLGPVFAVQGLALLGCLGFDSQPLTHSLHAGFLIMLGSTGAYLLVLFASRAAQTGRVATLRQVSVLIAMFLSGERPGTRAWLGTSLCLLGAMLIAI